LLIHIDIKAFEFKDYISSNEFQVSLALSTDSEEIKQVAAEAGLDSGYLRPEKLASDSAGKLDAIKDVLLYTEQIKNITFDYLVDLDVSAPMRTLEDLLEAFEHFRNNIETLSLFSVSKAHKNPYFNLVEEGQDGYFYLSKSGSQFLSRQSAPKVYEMNASFYFYRRQFFDKTKLYLFDKSLIYEMKHQSFDLDEPIDFEFLSYLLDQRKLPFTI